MGNRIHVAEIYQVSNSNSAHFSNRSVEINRLLFENCPGLAWEGEDVECSERLEVPRDELADLIGKIVDRRDDFSKWLNEHDIDCTADNLIRIIAGWISMSDQRNDFVVLTWY